MTKIYIFTFHHMNNTWKSTYEGIDDIIPSNYNSYIPYNNVYIDIDYCDIENEHFDEKVYDVYVKADTYEKARNDFIDFFIMMKTNYNLFNMYH